MEALKGTIEKVIFTGENNYSVISVKIPGKGKPITAYGTIANPIKKIEIVMEGSWEFSSKYKETQFFVERSECKMDNKKRAAVRFLSSGLIKYVGEATAQEIVQTFGTNWDEILAHPTMLLKIRGLTAGRLSEIIASLEENRNFFELYALVNGEITKKQAETIRAKYGDRCVEVIKENPYKLIYDVKGFGFKKADALARSMGFALESIERCRAGLLHCFHEAADEKGHCFLYYEDAMSRAVELLINADEVKHVYYERILKTTVPDLLNSYLELPLGDMAAKHTIKFNNFVENLEKTKNEDAREMLFDRHKLNADEISCMQEYLRLKERIRKEIDHILALESYKMDEMPIMDCFKKAGKNLSTEDPFHFIADKDEKGHWRYYDAKTYYLELLVAYRLIMLAKKESTIKYSDEECEALIQEYENTYGIELGGEQKEAVRKSLQNRVFITTGGPGRGKTTIEALTILGWERKGAQIELLAPTGRAAQRMSEATQEDAQTIHRKLISFEMGCEVPHGTELILVDEMSMVTLPLMARLLSLAENGDCHIGFIGDANQLPCIGIGKVFEDMIDSGVIPCTVLKTCYRNSGSISKNSDIINAGEPIDKLITDHAFKLLRTKDPESAQQMIVKIYGKMVERFGSSEVCVLVPCRQRGMTCTNALNRIIQSEYNPEKGKELRSGDFVFRPGDRVMNLKNFYDLSFVYKGTKGQGVFNGETGTVIDVNTFEKIVIVKLDDGKIVEFSGKYLKKLTLAYAMTVHKAQGSEYKCVISALMDSDYTLLCRKILYTLETRAKEMMVLMGSTSAITKAITNTYIEPRNTTEKERLSQMWNALTAKEDEVAENSKILAELCSDDDADAA